MMTETAGTVYMDCVQLEKMPTASRYNLINNGNFSKDNHAWTINSSTDTNNKRIAYVAAAPQLDAYVYQLKGNPQGELYLKQEVAISGNAGDTFVLAGWAKGDSAPLTDENRAFSLRGVFTYSDGSTSGKLYSFSFNPDADSSINWQYTAGVMIAEQDYAKLEVYLVYDYNVNTVMFDGIQLYKEEFGYSYTYDANGNVTAVKDIQGQTTEYTYNTKQELAQVELPTGITTSYTYDSWHNVKTATSNTGVVYNYTYDTYGNLTEISIGSGTSKITSSATYTDGNRLATTTDAAGNVTTYSYNADTNVLEWVKYPEDTEATRTDYTYDAMCRLTSAAATTDMGYDLTASYTYTNDQLKSITTASTTYTFNYGTFGLRSNVQIGSRTLASYTYSAQNHFLERLDYGNTNRVQYTYDSQGRVTRADYYPDGEDSTAAESYITYEYDNNGALATVYDSATGRTTTYYYDFTERLMKYVEDGSGHSHSVGYSYDSLNNLSSLVETINGVTHTTSYTYDDDNRISQIVNDVTTIGYTYDSYNRLSQKNIGATGYSYTYRTSNGSPTAQVSRQTLLLNNASSAVSFGYTYDNNGNILTYTDTGTTNSYVYDSAGQLIRENNQQENKTWVWTYDDAGNILSKTEYAYTTGTLGTVVDTIVYTYGDTAWGDLLTAYDGVAISYDGMGNPTSDGTWTYTWERGRQLKSMSNGTSTWTYTYDANGMRTSRTNGTTTYTYVYNGSQLSQMNINANTLYFTYDAAGIPATVTYNGTTYYYVTNLQGDVVAILNSSGTQVVAYTYDAWGNLLTATGSMASTLGLYNPLRYRGYVYDRDTGLYYLQSRYYDPATGRFLNADALVSTGQGLLGNNMFAYCNNNPVCCFDPTGMCPLCMADEKADQIKTSVDDGCRGGGGRGARGTSFRSNLQKYTGDAGSGQHAHHVFPKSFSKLFSKIGININDPKNGAWWNAQSHLQNSYQYNQWRKAFFSIEDVTAADARALADFLAQLFGFDWSC